MFKMLIKMLSYFILLFLSTSLHSSVVTLDIRSTVSNMVLEPDSIIVYSKSNNIYYKYTNTNKLDLDIITSVYTGSELTSLPKSTTIYTLNGQLIDTYYNSNGINNLRDIYGESRSGLYFLETVYQNNSTKRNILYLDASMNQFKLECITLDYQLESEYDITIYKHGYSNIVLSNVKVEFDETISVLLTPEYDKYYNKVTVNVKGLWKEGKVNAERTIDGQVKYSSYDSEKELNEEMVFNNSELRKLENDCYEKVMDGINQKIECEVDFPISKDTLYLCEMVCLEQNNNYSELNANTISMYFKETKDSLDFFYINYRKGSFEGGGSPSKKQQYKSIQIALSNLPVIEDTEKYIIILNGSLIKEHLSFFYWDEYYDGIDFHPPFDRGKLTSSYNGKLNINSDSEIRIEIIKSKK